MNIDEILNMIDDMLEEAWSLPFSGGRCVVDAQKVKECIEDIRLLSLIHILDVYKRQALHGWKRTSTIR